MARGGARPNSGRPKGSMDDDTKMRRNAEREYKRRVGKLTNKLLNAQLNNALGEASLYAVTYTGTGENRRKHVDIVTDNEVIKQYFAGDLDDIKDEFYYIATKSPDNRAIDSILDRTYGKATVNVESPDGSMTPTVIVEGVYGADPKFRTSNTLTETDEVAETSSNESSQIQDT